MKSGEDNKLALQRFVTHGVGRCAVVLACRAAMAPSWRAEADLGVPETALRSVVSLLPVWDGYNPTKRADRGPGEEPEGTAVAIRAGVGFNPIEDFIQTDASINPGASGGALIDATGRLVGIVSAIFTKKFDANIGVNFVASMELVNRVVADLVAQGRVIPGMPGLRLAKPSRAQLAKGAGAIVRGVAPDMAAARAGVRTGDMITRIGDRRITSPAAAMAAIHMYRVGQRFEIVVRRNGTALASSMGLSPRQKTLPRRGGRFKSLEVANYRTWLFGSSTRRDPDTCYDQDETAGSHVNAAGRGEA